MTELCREEDIRERVRASKQDHLLQFEGQLSADERRELFSELASVNFERLGKAFKSAKESLANGSENKDELLRPLEASICGSTSDDPKQTSQWRELGKFRYQRCVKNWSKHFCCQG